MRNKVAKRAVFFIGGYDPKTPAAFFNRMQREITRYEALWNVKASIAPVQVTSDGEIGSVRISAQSDSEGWSTSTDFHFLVLDKIVLADFARFLPVRLLKYLICFFDFLLTGTAFRFFGSAWRFALYFLFPFLAVCFFALLGFGAAITARHLLDIAWLGETLIGLAVFFLALAVLGKRWSVNHLMDLWSFSLNFFRGRRPDAEALMDRFARRINQRVSSGDYDEVLIVGHSTGGMLMLDVAARCLALDGGFSAKAPSVSLLTLGSTALKAGYHPAAKAFRQGVQMLVDDEQLQWLEVQCLTDVINFYKTDPVTEMKLQRAEGRSFPIVRSVRVKDMVLPDAYKRIKKNLFRVHYQYVFGNTKTYWYDFYQLCCGPVPIVARAESQAIIDTNQWVNNIRGETQPHDA